MQVIVDNLLTNYAEVGKGSSVILFLHGWADSSKTFEGLASQITENNAEYKAVMLDLPGFGATQSSGNDWDLQDFADFVRKFLDKLSLRPRTIVGHSNGGAIAIYGLANNVFESDNLILIASAGIRSKTAKKEILRYASKPAKLGLKLTPKQTQKRLKRKLYSSIGSDYLVAEHMQETFKKIIAHDVKKDAAKLKLPTLLIYGERDTATPPEYGKTFSVLIKGSLYHEIPLAGHFVHQEQIYKVASLCEGFMSQ